MESEALLPPMDFQSPPKPPKSFGFARPDQNVIEPPASGRPGRGRLAAVRRLSPTLDAAKNGRIGDGRPAGRQSGMPDPGNPCVMASRGSLPRASAAASFR